MVLFLGSYGFLPYLKVFEFQVILQGFSDFVVIVIKYFNILHAMYLFKIR